MNLPKTLINPNPFLSPHPPTPPKTPTTLTLNPPPTTTPKPTRYQKLTSKSKSLLNQSQASILSIQSIPLFTCLRLSNTYGLIWKCIVMKWRELFKGSLMGWNSLKSTIRWRSFCPKSTIITATPRSGWLQAQRYPRGCLKLWIEIDTLIESFSSPKTAPELIIWKKSTSKSSDTEPPACRSCPS